MPDILASPLTSNDRTGAAVHVPITDNDVLDCIAQLPHRWPEIMRRIYNGEELRRIWATGTHRLSWGEFQDGVAMAMGSLEILFRRRADRRLGKHVGDLPGGRELQKDLFRKWEGIAPRD